MKTIILLTTVILNALMVPASPPPVSIAIGQLWLGTYAELNPDMAEGWILLPGADDARAIPAGTSLFRWEDGAYFWLSLQVDADRMAGMETAVGRGERAVVALSCWACDHGRFILDSGTWDAERYLFNLDPALESFRAAGRIPVPEILEMGGPFPHKTVRVRIPLPETGDYGETSLIAGMALLGADKVMGPVTALWREIKRIPILRSRSKEDFVEIALAADDLPRFLAATLVIEDGRSLPLDRKPTLTHVGGWMETGPWAAVPGNAGCLAAYADPLVQPPAIRNIKAPGERWQVEIIWNTTGDLAGDSFQVYASRDAEDWTLVATVDAGSAIKTFDDERTYSWTHFLGDRALAPGLYYRVDLTDGAGAVLDTTWTRARLSDWR